MGILIIAKMDSSNLSPSKSLNPLFATDANCSSLHRLCWLLPRRHPAVLSWRRPTSGFHAKETEALDQDTALSSDKLKSLPMIY